MWLPSGYQVVTMWLPYVVTMWLPCGYHENCCHVVAMTSGPPWGHVVLLWRIHDEGWANMPVTFLGTMVLVPAAGQTIHVSRVIGF